ncbi:MAG: polyribonucleotide nucleotidyltransferase [Elusimicrobiota bacterium]
MEKVVKKIEVGGKTLTIETGHIARQANGACQVTVGDTSILVTAVSGREPKKDVDFMPLTVDFRERTYAAGKIPGGFFKRESRPRDKEILTSRLIDRTIRPLFPEFWRNVTQLGVILLSYDGVNDADVLGIMGASIALRMSDIPFAAPVAAVRIGRINGNFVIYPTVEEQKSSDLDLDMVVSGTKDAILMVEAGANELPESELIQALSRAHEEIKKICDFQASFQEKPKMQAAAPDIEAGLKKVIEDAAVPKTEQVVRIKEKSERELAWNTFKKELKAGLAEKYPEQESNIEYLLEDTLYRKARALILNDKVRTDGRKMDEIRPIECLTGVLPRTHGSAIFTRGQTQALVTATLGTPDDMQRMDELGGEYKERFLFHYNFPGFATGEPKPERSAGRREIGHGALARRALLRLLPSEADFPYTIRIVSDILESNGSSSMASVCGGSLALFDAGVPVKSDCAGIAMGLIKEDANYAILTDIMGMEDHLGDMDFKVAGTKKGITALQMDIKISGLDMNIMTEALERARVGRMFILDKMEQTMAAPKNEISNYAPSMVIVQIPQAKIGELIGPGGKNIRKLQEDTGAEINIEEDGRVFISSTDKEAVARCKELVECISAEAEVGKIYKGKVMRLMNFGAFVEILPGKEGLVHISRLAEGHVKKVEDVVKEGDTVSVKVYEIDSQNRINLSMKGVPQK